MWKHAFTTGIDTGVFECPECGALVVHDKMRDHDEWHERLASRVLRGWPQ